MPYHQQMSAVNMSIDCLNSTKYLALRDTFSIIEAASPQLKQALARMNQDHLTMSDEWFRLMNSRGWYQVPQARPETISRTMNQLQTVLSQTQAASPQMGLQQFQQSPGATVQYR